MKTTPVDVFLLWSVDHAININESDRRN